MSFGGPGWRRLLVATVCAIALGAPSPSRAEVPTSSTATSAPAALDLPALERAALAANVLIAVDRVKVEEARAMLEFARAQAYPQIRGQVLFGGPTPETKTRVRNDVGSLTDASYLADFDFGQLGVTVRAGAQLIQPLYTFGKISSGKEATEALVRAAEHNVAITQAEVLLNVHRAYWTYVLTRSFVRGLEEGQGVLGKVLDKVELLLDEDSPQVTENDRLRLMHAHATVGVRLDEARNGSAMALAALRMLIGHPQDAPLEVADADIDALPERLPGVDEVLGDAIALRPELLALRAVIDAQRAFVDLRWNQLYPDLAIGGVLDFARTTNATDQTNPFIFDPFNFFDIGVGLVLRFELDVFNKMALAHQAEAQLDTRLAQATAAAQGIELEARALHLDVSGKLARIELLRKAHRAARGWLSASVLAYDIGTGEAREVIDAFVARATAEAELNKTEYDVQIGVADLARVSGRLVAEAGRARP